MNQVSEQDISALKQWLDKQTDMPKDFEDIVLKKFLYSCENDLGKTQECLRRFCTDRVKYSKVYTDRDTLSPGLKKAFDITRVTTYNAGDDEILIHQLVDSSADKFNFYDLLKSFTVHSDNWLREEIDPLPEGHIVILDIKLYTLTLLPKINLFYFQKFLVHLIECIPIRLKQVHCVNCPALYEFMYGIIKPVLPHKVTSLIKFHSDGEGLHQYIDKKYLPKEYGGEANSLESENARWVSILQGKRDVFLNDNTWKIKSNENLKETKEIEHSIETLDVMTID